MASAVSKAVQRSSAAKYRASKSEARATYSVSSLSSLSRVARSSSVMRVESFLLLDSGFVLVALCQKHTTRNPIQLTWAEITRKDTAIKNIIFLQFLRKSATHSCTKKLQGKIDIGLRVRIYSICTRSPPYRLHAKWPRAQSRPILRSKRPRPAPGRASPPRADSPWPSGRPNPTAIPPQRHASFKQRSKKTSRKNISLNFRHINIRQSFKYTKAKQFKGSAAIERISTQFGSSGQSVPKCSHYNHVTQIFFYTVGVGARHLPTPILEAIGCDLSHNLASLQGSVPVPIA